MPDTQSSAEPQSAPEAREERWKILDNSIVVTVKDETYRFRIPTMADYAAIGSRAASIRRAQDPDRIGSLQALDMQTADSIWGFAAFELLLDKTSIEWPVSKNAAGDATINHKLFPLDRWADFMEVVFALDAALNRFRMGRVADGESASP